MATPALYTTPQAAEYCSLKLATFRYHIRRGHIGFASKIGANCMFTRAQLNRFMSETTFKPRRAKSGSGSEVTK